MLRRRWLVFSLGVLLVVGALIALGAAHLGPWAVQFLERQIPGQPTIKSWGVRFTPGVVLVAQGVEITGPPAWPWNLSFKAERVEFGLDLVSLFVGRLQLRRITVEAAELTLAGDDRRRDEAEVRARRQPSREAPGAYAPRVVAADPLPVEIRAGRVTVRGERVGTIAGLDGRLVYSRRTRAVEYRFGWSPPGGGRIHLTGSVAPTGAGALKVTARVESSEGPIAGQATLEGDVRGPLRAPRLSARIAGKGEMALLPGIPVSVAGSGSGDVTLESPSDMSRLAGTLSLQDGQLGLAGHSPLEAFRGRINWTSLGAESPALTGRWGSATVSARFRVMWGTHRPTLRGDVSVSPIDPAPLLRRIAEAIGREPAPPSHRARFVPPAHAGVPQTIGPEWLRRLGVDLRFRVASLRLNGEPLGPLRAQLVAENGLWHLQGVRLTLEEGEPRGYLRLDLRPPRPRGTLFAHGPGLAFLRDGLPEPYRLAGGQVFFETVLHWEGLTWREVRQSLRGQGELRIRDGILATAGLSRHVEIQGLASSGREARPLLRFDELSARYRVTGPRVSAQSLVLSGPAWEIRGEGAVDFSGHLEFQLTGHSPRIQRLTGRLQGDLARPRLVLSP